MSIVTSVEPEDGVNGNGHANGHGNGSGSGNAHSGPHAPAAMACLIVGAGQAGRVIARDLRKLPEFGLLPIGFVDDDPARRAVLGLPVLGTLAQLPEVCREHHVDAVVIAIPSLPSIRIRELAERAAEVGAHVRYLPSFVAALERQTLINELRSLRISSLLGRQEMRVVRTDSQAVVAGKRVLVTGAGGSIGSELCRQIKGFGPAGLYLLDHDESNLHRLQMQLEGQALLDNDQLIIADIRDAGRIHQIFRALRPQVVFHAAAHKHLPLLERHPAEGVKSNVLGTKTLVGAALESAVERFILISTDKAADPVSILGATKRIAEMIVQSRAGGATRFASVRFGNVLGSRGSFLAVLSEQIEKGEMVTVTHPDVTRFFMTVEEAVGLVIEAASMAEAGETFVLDMGNPVRIVDLVHSYAAQMHVDTKKLQIRFTGLRQGEKLNEDLFSKSEQRTPTAHPKITATVPPAIAADFADRLDALIFAASANRPPYEIKYYLSHVLPEYRPPQEVLGENGNGHFAYLYPDDF
ncbi:MAG TPA: nucleoside-diphosphate sugar epimerase/dehydratase [Candidatus Dormibacteraeota bacterium]